jgi:hypothetical protein
MQFRWLFSMAMNDNIWILADEMAYWRAIAATVGNLKGDSSE